MMPQRGVFIGQRRDRIGARLLMILSCIRMSEDYGTDYKVNWFPQGADAPELDNPEELFAQNWMDQHFLDKRTYDALCENSAPIWDFQNDKNPDRLLAHISQGRCVIIEEGFEVLAFPWEDPTPIRQRYRDFIKEISFAPDIAAVMSDVDEILSGKEIVAYHIRRGDILNALPWKHSTWPAKIEPEEYYDAHLQKSVGKPAIMFSDQPELLERFQSRFPALKKMADIADLSAMTRAQRDFLELYAMSRADEIVAPVISAFSMAAARISGSQRLVFRDVLNEEQLQQANERVIERVAQGADAFLNPSEAAHIYSKAAQYLNADDRCEEAYRLAAPILRAGADNAFLPVLQALNCFYLGLWEEAEEIARTGLENASLWPEDHAVLCAVHAATLGAQKKRWGAGLEFARAFWAKPMRPDVIVVGSRMAYRDQLPRRLFPPIDWTLQTQVRQRRFTPFNNMYLVQHKVIKRRPCNFDMILLDWHELALDRKAQRILSDPQRLALLCEGLDNAVGIDPSSAGYRSLRATLSFRQGILPVEKAIDEAKQLVALEPERPLFHKRLADLYEADGDIAAARFAHANALAIATDDPFVMYSMGQFLVRTGAVEQGQNQIIEAADLSPQCATVPGEAGQILLRRGERESARPYLQSASILCPSFKRFKNQLKRSQ